MNLIVVLILVVLVVLTVIAVIAQVYCTMAETRRSKRKVTPVKKDQSKRTRPLRFKSLRPQTVETVRKIA
jgi:flagellar basal body-associated protein FliL